VVDVGHEQRHAHQHQPEGDADRDARHEEVDQAVLAPHLPQGHEGIDEGGGEDPKSELVLSIPQEGAQHPGRELAAGQLQHDHRDGEHQGGEGEHRGGDRAQEAAGALRPAGEGDPPAVALELLVELHEGKRQPGGSDDAGGGDEPKGRTHTFEQAGRHAGVLHGRRGARRQTSRGTVPQSSRAPLRGKDRRKSRCVRG